MAWIVRARRASPHNPGTHGEGLDGERGRWAKLGALPRGTAVDTLALSAYTALGGPELTFGSGERWTLRFADSANRNANIGMLREHAAPRSK
ncbi:hypothetical protein ABH941_007445 [Streptacidiphilus sp. EB103A]